MEVKEFQITQSKFISESNNYPTWESRSLSKFGVTKNLTPSVAPGKVKPLMKKTISKAYGNSAVTYTT